MKRLPDVRLSPAVARRAVAYAARSRAPRTAAVLALLLAGSGCALGPSPAVGGGAGAAPVVSFSWAGDWVAPAFVSNDTPAGPVLPRLRFAPDGQAGGSGGCNTFGATYVRSDTGLRFGPVASTRKACLGAAMGEEQRFFAALERTRAWRVAGDALELLDAAGAVTVRLVRAP